MGRKYPSSNTEYFLDHSRQSFYIRSTVPEVGLRNSIATLRLLTARSHSHYYSVRILAIIRWDPRSLLDTPQSVASDGTSLLASLSTAGRRSKRKQMANGSTRSNKRPLARPGRLKAAPGVYKAAKALTQTVGSDDLDSIESQPYARSTRHRAAASAAASWAHRFINPYLISSSAYRATVLYFFSV